MSRMSKKHYEAIARILADARDAGTDEAFHTVSAITVQLAKVFEEDNPRFDSQRFIDATWSPKRT